MATINSGQKGPSLLPISDSTGDDPRHHLGRDAVVIGFVLTLAVLIVGGWVGYINVGRLADNNQWVAHTDEVIGSLDALLSTLKDVEIGARGYLLVKDKKYLESYEIALLQVKNEVARLNDLISDNPEQQANSTAMEHKIDVKLLLSKQAVALMMKDDRPAALKLVRSDRGNAAMDDLGQHIAVMKQVEYDLLRKRTEQFETSYRRTLSSILLPAIIGVVLLAVMFYLSQRNIDQTQRAGAVLAEQKERLRTTLASIGDAVITTDTAARITNMNAVAESLTGWKNDDAIGKPLDTVFRVVNEKTRRSVGNPATKALKEGVVVGLANHSVLIARDDTERPIDDNAAPIRCKQGEIVGCVLVFRDVTERRKAQLRLSESELWIRTDTENRLEESEGQLRELAAHIHLALWVIDPRKDKVLYISPGYEKIWGRSGQSLIDDRRSYLEGIHPLDQEMVNHEDAAMFDTGQIDVECRVLRPDGSMPWVWIRGYAVRNDQGQTVRVVCIAEDVTQRKLSQDDQGRLAAIVECSDDAVVSSTLEGVVITWNRGAERLYGYTAEEMIGQNIRLLYATENSEEFLRVQETVVNGERIPSYDTKRLQKNGTSIAVSVSISPIRVKNGEIVGASNIAHDITRVKQLEAQFRQAQKMEAVGTLAGGVAHDFNNLLTIISGYSELLLSKMPPTDSKRAALTAIHNAGERAASLTQQLLAFSRKTVLAPKILDLNEVVKETESMLRRLIGEDILLRFLPDPGIHRIQVDPGLLGQVLMNLAVNSRDAMPQGGNLTIETCNSVIEEAYCQDHAGAKPGKFVQLTMTDTGSGMTPQIKARVFEPFFTTKGVGQGTGLGLAVVYGIIKQSDGYIEVNSEPGAGTCFKLYFQSVDREADNRAADPVASIVHHGTETVLLVEDEDGVRGIALLALQMHGYTVLTARDGKDALRVVGKHEGNIDMLVTDVVMPGMNGQEVAHTLVPMFPRMKTLFISGYTDDAIIRNGLVQEQIDFLQKPFGRNRSSAMLPR
jgi:PAS domain S-box-containing protein